MHAADAAQQAPGLCACSTACAHHLKHQPGQDLGLLGGVLQCHAARPCLQNPSYVCLQRSS